ncbi:Uncharacterised protein [Mycobacteroides abscessus subsp. abscessus]|nr:Uncharacterised protein [Mycobacteroides abscessus subsp. abscessus]
MALDFWCCPSNVESTGHQVDVLDAKADEFGPAQAGVGEDCHDVALVAARDGKHLDLLCGQVAVTLPLGNATR